MALYSCPVCSFPCYVHRHAALGRSEIDCFRCGKFSIGDQAKHLIEQGFTREQIANLSGYLRETQGVVIVESDIEALRNIQSPPVAQKAAKLLAYLSRKFSEPGTIIRIDSRDLRTRLDLLERQKKDGKYPDDSFPDTARAASEFVSVASAASAEELGYLFDEFLVKEGLMITKGTGAFVITPAGWQRIEDLKRTQTRSEKAFIAMSFADELLPLFTNGLAPGVSAAGYQAIRIDRTEHNNRIDDEIVAAIRQTKFTVADFTGNRQSVYFEAGFALGLGRPVIWTVRRDQIDDLHFDTRQYNFIRWQEDNLPEFATALKNRIIATIGQGPLSVG